MKKVIWTIILWVIIFCIVYYVGSRINAWQDAKEPDITKILQERDSLRSLMAASETREQWYREQLKLDSSRIARLEAKQKITERKIHHYETKIKEIDNMVISDLDSFFIHWYPDSIRPGRADPGVEGQGDRERRAPGPLFRYFGTPERYSVDPEVQGDRGVKEFSKKPMEGNRGEGRSIASKKRNRTNVYFRIKLLESKSEEKILCERRDIISATG